ncbi:MAG: PorT family protein [Spirosoma sp.]|nr:PorT family protein [Spirosoma sp.]
MAIQTLFRYGCVGAVFYLLLFATASAQQRFSAGPRVGLTYSTFAGDAQNFSSKPGISAGAFLMYSSLNHFGISGDVLYSQRGAKYNVPGPVVNSDKRTVNYLEIPIALRYFLTLKGNFRPNVYFGPALAFKLNAKQSSIIENGRAQATRDISSEFRPVDLGVLAGFQLNWPGLGTAQRFLIDARYTYGLSDITTNNNLRINNSAFTLSLGYGFGVGPVYRSRYRK